MIFFTSILIICILYYLQADGLIYVTIVAVIAELINILMTQALTKSVEKKTTAKFGKIVVGYKTKIAVQKKTIKELEDIREKSVGKLYKANLKIKEYEEKLELDDTSAIEEKKLQKPGTPKKKKSPKNCVH